MSLSMSSWHACLCATHSQEFSLLSASRVDNTRRSLYKITYNEELSRIACYDYSSQRLSKDACHEDLSDHTQRLLFSILCATLHRFSRHISNKSSHSLSSTCMEQLTTAVHPTRIDGCAEEESVALATAVHATRIHTEVDIMKSSSAQIFYFVEESRSQTEKHRCIASCSFKYFSSRGDLQPFCGSSTADREKNLQAASSL